MPINREVVERLKRSYEKRKWYYPILRAADGEIIDGAHRYEADHGWKEVTLMEVKTEEEKVLAKIGTNLIRRIPEDEEIGDWFKSLVKMGWTAQKIADESGLSLSTIYKYIPQEVKDPKKAKSGGAGGSAPRLGAKPDSPESSSVGEKGEKIDMSQFPEETEVEDIAAPPPSKKPRTGATRTQSESTRKEGTPSENLLQNFVQSLRFKDKPLDFDFGKPIVYGPDEEDRYVPDATVSGWLLLEAEGKGSSSSDNPKREKILQDMGKRLLHMTNDRMKDPWYLDLASQAVLLALELGPPPKKKE